MSTTLLATVEARADAADAVEAALRAMIRPSRAEAGCHHYALFAAPAAPGTFYLLESYADDAALAAHHASRHFAALVASIGDKLVSEISITRINALEA